LGECDNEDGTGREVVIEVKDSGRGISDEDLTRIFSPFFSTNPNGAGLGLPAVKRVARAHGGRVEVTSTPGMGSTFTIRLPRQSMALEEKYASHE
jgi:signal transduction histidine kinase